MPTAPLKPCATPGCAALIDRTRTRCPLHTTEQNRIVTERIGSSSERGYDARWRRLRFSALRRDNFICVGDDCVKANPPRMTPAEHVDHIIPFDGLDDARRLDIDNLQSLCRVCHQKKTRADQKLPPVPQPAPLKRKKGFA